MIKKVLILVLSAAVLCGCRSSVPSIGEAAVHDEKWLNAKLDGSSEEKIVSVWQDPDYRMAQPEETVLYYHHDEPAARIILTLKNHRFDSAAIETGENIQKEYAGDIYCEAAVYFLSLDDGRYYLPVFCVHKKLTDHSIRLEDANRQWFYDLVYEYGEEFETDHQDLQRKINDHIVGNLKDFEDCRVPEEKLSRMIEKISDTKITVYLDKETNDDETHDYIFTMIPKVIVDDEWQ